MTALVEAKTTYLTDAITEWYKNANQDYGVSGRLISIIYFAECDTLTIIVDEDDERYQCNLKYSSDYSAEELYNIWMEFGTYED